MLRRSLSTQRHRRHRDHSPSSTSSPVETDIKPGLLRNQVEAWTNLVARYRRRNPHPSATPQHGIYSRLDPDSDEIRLLTILPSAHADATVCCTISTLPLPSAAALGYDALSYCWGTGRETRTLLVNDVLRHATLPLEAALRCLRSATRPVRVWADALCINQSDTRERNHQVSLMHRIYRNAATVRACLHPVAPAPSPRNPSDCDEPDGDLPGADLPLPHPRSLRLVASLRARRARWQRKNAYSPVAGDWGRGDEPRPSAPTTTSHRDEQLQRNPWSNVESAGFQTLPSGDRRPVAHEMLGLGEGDVLDLVALFAHPWWSRIWVVQEVLLAGRCVVHVTGEGEEESQGEGEGEDDAEDGEEGEWKEELVEEEGGKWNGKMESEGRAGKWNEEVEFSDVVRAGERLWNVLDSLESSSSAATGLLKGRHMRAADLRARTAGARAFLRILAVCHLEPEEGGSLVQILGEARALLATDPRDQIFGLVGLSPFLRKVEPDYSLTLEQSFVKAAERIMRSTDSLDMLYHAGSQLNRLAALPTWVPDWSARESGQSLRYVAVRNLYSASGMSRPSFAMRRSRDLSVRGIAVDIVDQTTTWEICEDPTQDMQVMLTSIRNLSSRLREHDKTGSATGTSDILTAMRTVAMDVVRSGGPLQRGFAGAVKYYGLDGGEAESILRGDIRLEMEKDEVKEPRSLGRFLADELAPNLQGHRLCNTKTGRLCLLPDSSRQGDVIQLLAGLSMPAVLRSCGGSRYQLVGMCYLDGMMDNISVGNALQLRGSANLSQFKTIILV